MPNSRRCAIEIRIFKKKYEIERREDMMIESTEWISYGVNRISPLKYSILHVFHVLI